MDSLRSLARGLAALSFLAGSALAACSPASPPTSLDKTTAWIRNELLKTEKTDTAMGDLFFAMRQAQPDLYTAFVETAGRELSAGKSPFEAGAAGRPLYLKRFVDLMKTSSDENTNELLAFSRVQMQHSLAVDPVLCARLARGQADERAATFPKDLVDRELRLMTRVMRAGEQGALAANATELDTWTKSFIEQHPEALEGIELMQLPAPSADQAKDICLANMLLLDALLAEEPARRAELFRGLLAMS